MAKKPEKDISVFRLHKPGIRKVLGDLEADIMEAVWDLGPGASVTVREVHERLKGPRGAAYTTVMTIMGVLVKKGMLAVNKSSFAHRYRAKQTREAFTRLAVGRVLDQLLTEFAEPTLAHFMESMDEEEDARALTRLQEIIARRREKESP